MRTTEIRHRHDQSILVPRYDRGVRAWIEITPERTEASPVLFRGVDAALGQWSATYWHDGERVWLRHVMARIASPMCRPLGRQDVTIYLFTWNQKAGQWDTVDQESMNLAVAG